jgi:DNA-binding MarR family transcriptional regulator
MKTESLVDLIYGLKARCVITESEIMAETGLSPAEYNGIAAIEPGEMVCGNAVSQKMNLSPSRASRVIDKMVHNGYIHRKTDTADRRKCNITLADKGVAVKKRIKKLREGCEDRLRLHLSEKEIKEFSHTLKKIVASM